MRKTDSIIKKILGAFGFSNSKTIKNSRINSDDISNKKVENNFYGPVTIINSPFSNIKTEEDYKEKLNSAYENNKEEKPYKLTISKYKKDTSIRQIRVLNQNKSEIEKLKYLGLSSTNLELVQNAIFLSKLGRKKIKQEKIKLNSVQKRILNLYSSKWINKFLSKFTTINTKKADINKEFELLIYNWSIIFVNEFTEEDKLKEQLESSLSLKNICYLHAIGRKNIALCEKTLNNPHFLLDIKKEGLEEGNVKFSIRKELF